MGTNRRDAIEMTAEERTAFLQNGKTIYLASNGADGYPHLIAMWYALDGDVVEMTTYRKSQKVANLLRDPRCTLLLEEGGTYAQLKGLFVRGRCEVIDDAETTFATLQKVGARAGRATPGVHAAGDAGRATPGVHAAGDAGRATPGVHAAVDAGSSGSANRAATVEALRSRARKRVTLRFHADKVRSWDHAKLGGAY